MDKQYVGHGKVVTTQYGDILKMSLTAENVETLQKNLENGWVNFDVLKRKAPSEKGMTHYGVLNTWKPENADSAPASPTKKAEPTSVEEMDPEDLPF